jgi:hypothetical protein
MGSCRRRDPRRQRRALQPAAGGHRGRSIAPHAGSQPTRKRASPCIMPTKRDNDEERNERIDLLLRERRVT